MKLAIMQPYFFPYIGYFQLICAVDKFIILDDVNYIKGGWINRNKIIVNNESKWFTLSLEHSSPNRIIKEVSLNKNKLLHTKLLKTLNCCYGKSPFFPQTYNLLSYLFNQIFTEKNYNLSRFLYRSLISLKNYVGLTTEIIETSSIYPKANLKGQERILDICIREKATHYINLPGGKDLYSQDIFQNQGIELSFLQPVITPYNQGRKEFIPNLSILDVLMWNSPEDVLTMVNQYELIK